jgi:lipoic acid synthetase
MGDLVEIGCDILTFGQYLQPTAQHLPVARFVHPDLFREFKEVGEKIGIPHVEAGPLVRSSYHAKSQRERVAAGLKPIPTTHTILL